MSIDRDDDKTKLALELAENAMLHMTWTEVGSIAFNTIIAQLLELSDEELQTKYRGFFGDGEVMH